MPLALIPAVIAGATWLSRIGMAAFAINEIKNLLTENKPTLEAATTQAEASGLSGEEQQKMSAAVTYEKVEELGKSPDEFWGSLTPAEREKLKFSPESLRADTQRTTFLGTAQTLLWIGAGVAAGFASFKGLPVSVKELARISTLRQKGASATVIANELALMKTAILNKTWVPGAVAGILGTGGWLTGGLMNNLNDATLWGRIFLSQAHDDVQKAAAQAEKNALQAGGGSASSDLPKTIIRMVTEQKPQQFLGTLFSSKLGTAEQFERKIDDKITDMDDLEADVKINLNRWLKSLPNRMGYSIVIRKDPVDEYGAQQSGIWATLTLFITHISGKTTPIDTILLGPVEPQVRLELQKKTTTIENHISGFVDATTVKEIQIPAGSVDIFSANGTKVAHAEDDPAEVERLTKTRDDLQKQIDDAKAKGGANDTSGDKMPSNTVGVVNDNGRYIFDLVGGGNVSASGGSYQEVLRMARVTAGSVGKPLVVDQGGSTATPTQPKTTTYTVQAGDSLGAIAKKYGVALSDISGYRSGNPNLIFPGEILTIRNTLGSIS